MRGALSYKGFKTMKRLAFLALVFALAANAPARAAVNAQENDYPTEARADYVFGCMAANGQTREAVHRCACSIDVVASILPYDQYVDAETVLTMRQGIGRTASLFKDLPRFDEIVANLRRAQAEGEIRCFK
jgi:hypothetical protein